MAILDAPTSMASGALASKPPTLRRDIQALRAFAVVAVLLYHLWPNRLPGGYIGVDVFFVISGFLITGHLVKELAGGRLQLARFYARRVRRLAPASLAVLLVTLAAVAAAVPVTEWERFGREISASALLYENFFLSASAVDYLAADELASPVQHFWTLSVEEQFYLIWPLVIFVIGFFASTRKKVHRSLWVAIVAVTIGSLALSVYYTSSSPAAAYFVTFTRIWEFGFGAMLALVSRRLSMQRLPSRLRACLVLAGAVGLVAAAFMLDPAKFAVPGAIMLIPVGATVAVIAATDSNRPAWLHGLFSMAPVQMVGNLSFGIYLWHWPLIVLFPYVTGHELTTFDKLAIAAASVALAWLSYRFVETPFRFNAAVKRGTMVTLSVGISAAVLVALGGYAVTAAGVRSTGQAQAEALELALGDDPCIGARALQNAKERGDVHGVLSPQDAASAEKSMPFTSGCIDPLSTFVGAFCESGSPPKIASQTVLLWGDSHAASWEPTFDVATRSIGAHLTTAARQGCPPGAGAPDRTVGRDIPASEERDCADRNAQVLELATSDPKITDVVIASYSRNYIFTGVSAQENITRSIRAILAAGKNVIFMRDVPMTGTSATDRLDIPACVASHLTSLENCDNLRSRATDPPQLADTIAEEPGMASVQFVEPAAAMCDQSICYGSLGRMPVFADSSHLAASFARTLAPWLLDAVRIEASKPAA